MVSLGLTLTAAGYGFTGWVWIGAVAAPVLLVAGIALVLLERKRVKAKEGKSSPTRRVIDRARGRRILEVAGPRSRYGAR